MQTLKTRNRGTVILAGAGPGDPDLITLKTLKYIQQATVILTDRLVAPELIRRYARPDAIIVEVGKQCARGIHTPQQQINELLIHYAQEHQLVLRLKGGDVSIFSNILDELDALSRAGIRYEIIPGITAASGAAAYTGMPLTARNYAQAVRFVTLYQPQNIAARQWQDWADTDDTLVFYMSGRQLRTLAQGLLQHHIDKTKGIAVIQQATTSEQQTDIYTFATMDPEYLPDFDYVPTLIVVGKVVSLQAAYAWYPEKKGHVSSYFDHPIHALSHAI